MGCLWVVVRKVATMEHVPAPAPEQPARMPISTLVTPSQQVELGRGLREVAALLTEVNEESGDVRTWRARLREGLALVSEVVGAALVTGGRLRTQAPDNWPTSLTLYSLRSLIEDGFPVLWVPNQHVLEEMARASDRSARQAVLLKHQGELVAEAAQVLRRVTALDLADDRKALEQCLSCLPSAWMPAQTLALIVAATRTQTEGDLPTQGALRRRANAANTTGTDPDLEDIGQELTLAAIAPALAQFTPGETDIPDRPNRHAVAHTVSAIQQTPGNALEAVLLAVSVLRQAQAARERARQGSAVGIQLA